MAGKAVLVSIFMEKLQDVKGLGGMLNGFRDLVKDDKKIAFVGSPGFCTPFALFLGYPVREKELAFVQAWLVRRLARSSPQSMEWSWERRAVRMLTWL